MNYWSLPRAITDVNENKDAATRVYARYQELSQVIDPEHAMTRAAIEQDAKTHNLTVSRSDTRPMHTAIFCVCQLPVNWEWEYDAGRRIWFVGTTVGELQDFLLVHRGIL